MKGSELLRLIERDGWFTVRITGSHRIMKHPTKSGILSVPIHGTKEVGTGLANKLLKQAGLK